MLQLPTVFSTVTCCTDDVNILGGSVHTVKENAEALVVATKEITNILDKIDEYRKKWLLHIHRMPQNRIPLKSYNYRPQGRRSIGRPKKRWREQL